MYLFYVDRNWWIPMGNDGQLAVPKSIRSRRALLKLAKSWLGNRAGEFLALCAEAWRGGGTTVSIRLSISRAPPTGDRRGRLILFHI